MVHLWPSHFVRAQRLSHTRGLYLCAMQEDELKDAVLMVFANKQVRNEHGVFAF